MDIVERVRSCLSKWKGVGELECRIILAPAHCNPSDSGSISILTTAYHTLLSATLTTWSPKHTLSVDALVTLVQSILENLPSTSSSLSSTSSNAAIFGEHLVDMIWSIDAELDEILADVKTTVANCGEQGSEKPNPVITRANKAKQNVETDKATLSVIVKKFLSLGVLNPNICRERFDSAILESTGLTQDKSSLDKKEIRTRTGLFYKQNKFNLLREQSEGYSKLTVELTSSLGSGHSPATGRPIESYASVQERARPVWEKIISLIGYFDLDPNKALDIILDVLSVNLASHYTFFIALLSCSPWSRLPSLDVSGVEPMTEEPAPGRFQGKSLDEILTLADPKASVTADSMPKGSRVLAQVLGFKFTFYHSPEASEPPPKSLYLTAALLIREGFITLEDLYPHLSPSDPDMEKVHAAYLKDVHSRISAARMSQLAMAAPLESATSSSFKSKPTASPTEQKKTPEPRDPPNEKAGMLIALLSIGALKPAISVLSKFPWLVDAQPEIADLIIRIMKVSMSPLYDSYLTKERNPSFAQPRSRYGTTGVMPPAPQKFVLTLWAPTPPSTNTTDFVFFFPDWTEQVPICTCLDDLIDVIEPFMRFIGLHVSRDPLFLTKYMRLGRAQINTTVPVDPITKKPIGEPDPENPIRQSWFRILRQYLLPALPLIRGNAVCTVEIWNIIRQYETTARWRLYGEWRSLTYKSHPELRIREVQADRESKGILRRLSHKTIDSLAGPVAKLAHSNPCIFFTNAVNQIMAYDNLAAVVIQALRYVTNMGFEVLIFIILDAFANPRKERVKDDGVNTSDWLQSLASFAGMLFRRYSADLTPMLKYVVHQLYNGQTTEIVVLRELIWKMAGIEPLPSLSDSQIQAMAGGPALRIESIASSTRGARLDPGDAVLKGPQRLGRALMESSLALPLLIQVAQQRQSSVFLARDTHLKSLASLYDTTHGVLLQYLELLTTPSVISPQDYANKILPTLGDLSEKYGICAPICMQIFRPVLHTQLLAAALEMQEQEKIANEEVEKRLKAALKTKREPSVSQSRVASPGLVNSNSNTAESADPKSADTPSANEDVTMEAESTPAVTVSESPWLPQLEVLFEDVKKTIPANAYDVLGPGFYITFWQLSTYDLSPPAAKYDEEGAALRTLSRQEDGKYAASERAAERARRQMAGTHRARRDRYNSFVQMLVQEYKEQTISRAFTIKRLSREKQHWFTNVANAAQKQTQALLLLDAFMEHCIQPRCLLSPMDADFCAQFIKVLHTQGTPGFHTLACYNKILNDQVKIILFSCSEYEARNYGRFLLGVLADLHKWHTDEQTYIQDNRSKVGGKTVLHTGFQVQYKLPMPPEYLLKWPDYQRAVRKWHKKIALAFVECIQTGEFMHVYNAIIVLKEILPYFPLSVVSQESGTQLDRAMDQFLEKEERGDLKILGRAYSASLKKREQYWAPTKVPSKPSASTASPRPTGPAAEKPRTPAPTPGPGLQTGGDVKRTQPAISSAPSGPRAQLANAKAAAQPTKTPIQPANAKPVTQLTDSKPVPQPASENMNGVSALNKSAMDSVPRPPVVKRVRPDTNGAESAKPPGETRPEPKLSSSSSDRKDDAKTTSVPKDPPVRGPRASEDKPPDSQATMPPPSAPSQTHSAQELRETAKQSINKTDDKTGRSADPQRSQNGSAAPSPRHRSSSPSSRPGTRNHSSESRTSTGRTRADRGNTEGTSDDKRSDRDARDHSGPTRRDSLTHSRSDRGARERTTTGDGERDKDKDRESRRDRHGDRERDRERDRDRDRERDKDRDRERDRDRDRDRHGDRHRRDEKERDRESRKDRDASSRSQAVGSGGGGSSAPAEDRIPPSRPDPSRHRNGADDGLGKRRRGPEEESDRGSKRSSRKEGKDAHREDRSRRPGEKSEHDRNRESDRRRRTDRDTDGESRGQSSEKGEKRLPEGPLGSGSKILPASTPSAPRAMSTTDTSRSGKGESGSGRSHREHSNHNSLTGSNAVPIDGGGPGSLRSRISDKEAPPRTPQATTQSYHSTSRKDDRDPKKRGFGERDSDTNDKQPPTPTEPYPPPKRPRLNRSRYQMPGPGEGSHAFAKKSLPINPQAGDKLQGRKD